MPKAIIEPNPEKTPEVPREGQLLRLALDQIELDPITDVRTGPVARDEGARLDQLAKTIYEQGQLQPVLVRVDGDTGRYRLIAGRRRYAACKLIEEKTGQPIQIEALVVAKNDEEAWVASLNENLQRRQFSPIELAQNITEIRNRKGYNGEDWSKQVADFMHVSRATVTQHAKLLSLPAEIQAKVHKGDLSAQSALELLSIEDSKRSRVLAKAEALAEEEATQPAKGKRNATAPVSEPGKRSSAKAEEEEKGKVKHKHILAAARESDATEKARTRSEIVKFFEQILDSADPYPEAVADFAKTFVNRWVTGQVGDRALINKLNTISELCSERKPKPVKKAS